MAITGRRIRLLVACALSLLAASMSDPPPVLGRTEQESVYRVLSAINSAIDWRSLFPSDLCLGGPHGVVCDYFDDGAHVTELHFGYLSDYSPNPPCGPNPRLSHHLSRLPRLRKLLFYKCFAMGPATGTPLPGYFWNLTSLEELVLVDNPSLAGPIPPQISNLLLLRRLIVTGTTISGRIPAEIGALPRLQQLVLSRGCLTGALPPQLGALRRLRILDLSLNALGGEIPAELSRLPELVKLDLSHNRIGGRIPDRLVELKRLELLDLSHNHLGRQGVPRFLAELPRLREVYLSGNGLGGTIPEIWEKMGGVVGLGLSGLGLVGKIPGSMGVFLQNVCYLGLDNNMLSGPVPQELGQLVSLKEMNLENNLLSGEVSGDGFGAKKVRFGGNRGLCVKSEKVEGPFGGLKACARSSATPDAVVALLSAASGSDPGFVSGSGSGSRSMVLNVSVLGFVFVFFFS